MLVWCTIFVQRPSYTTDGTYKLQLDIQSSLGHMKTGVMYKQSFQADRTAQATFINITKQHSKAPDLLASCSLALCVNVGSTLLLQAQLRCRHLVPQGCHNAPLTHLRTTACTSQYHLWLAKAKHRQAATSIGWGVLSLSDLKWHPKSHMLLLHPPSACRFPP